MSRMYYNIPSSSPSASVGDIPKYSNGTNSSANRSNNDNTSGSADVSDIDNGTTIRINSVIIKPERIFMNNNMLMEAQEHNTNDAALVTNVNGHTIGQPSDMKVGIIKFIPIQAPNEQFRNKYLQEIEKYPSINFTNPDISNIKFNNFGKMLKYRTAIGLDTLDNYFSENMDKVQREYLLLSSLNSIKNSLSDDIATFRYCFSFFYDSKFAQYGRKRQSG